MRVGAINNNNPSFGVLRVFPGKSSVVEEIALQFVPERPLGEQIINGAILVFEKGKNQQRHAEIMAGEAHAQALTYPDSLWHSNPNWSQEALANTSISANDGISTIFGVLKVDFTKVPNLKKAEEAFKRVVEIFKPEQPLGQDLRHGAILVLGRDAKLEQHLSAAQMLKDVGARVINYSGALWHSNPGWSKESLAATNFSERTM